MRGQGRHEGRGHGGRIDGATWGLGAAQGIVGPESHYLRDTVLTQSLQT